MAASHRHDHPQPFSSHPVDENYGHEQRRRRNDLPRLPRLHYPGDGLDYRRPIMSTSSDVRQSDSNGGSNAVVIDLTDEDGTQESQDSERQPISSSEGVRVAAGSSRAQRLPRWGRALVDFPSSDDGEDINNTSNLPGARYLALPGVRLPHYSDLRRPAPEPSPPPEMEGDIEVIASQDQTQRRPVSDRSLPPSRARRAPRSLTPYPANLNEPIDLTQDDDDDVVHLDTRQREGTNQERPIATANVGTRSWADRGLDQMGNLASLIRDGGVNVGGRLMQRLGGIPGLNQELRAQQQVFDQFQHNHGHRHVHRHHHHHRQAGAAAPPVGNVGALRNIRELSDQLQDLSGRLQGIDGRLQRMGGGMQINMDYGMTGFDMGYEGGNRPPTPKYTPPPEPQKGFTRSPCEDEIVVCPNCGDELAVGDGDVKQELWAIKGCGHVYCGECAQNRGRSRSKKGKGKAPAFDDSTLPAPFRHCVVEGCGVSASARAMVHVFLGS